VAYPAKVEASTPAPDRTSTTAARILDTFARRARVEGIRAVKMTELASELGISTRKIYETFDSKEALVNGLLQRWIDVRWEREDVGLADIRDVGQRIKRGALDILAHRQQFSAAFWRELQRDYPVAWAEFERQANTLRERAKLWLSRKVKAGLPAELSASILIDFLIECALHVEDEMPADVSREALIETSVDIWVAGALDDAR